MRYCVASLAIGGLLTLAVLAAVPGGPSTVTPDELRQIRAGDGSCQVGQFSGAGCIECLSDGNGFYVQCDVERDEHACTSDFTDCYDCVSTVSDCIDEISRYADEACSELLDPQFDSCYRMYDDVQVDPCGPGEYCI